MAFPLTVTLRLAANGAKGYKVELETDSGTVSAELPEGLFAEGGALYLPPIAKSLAERTVSGAQLVEIGEAIAENVLSEHDLPGAKWRELLQAACDEYAQWCVRDKNEQLSRQQPLFRTILRVPSDLAALPWEALAIDGAPVFFERCCSLVRSSGKFLKVQKKETWPIRVLLVVGVEPSEGEILKTREETYGVVKALRKMQHSFVLKTFYPGKEGKDPVLELKTEIETNPPDILHFIGHASADPPGLMVRDVVWEQKDIASWIKTQSRLIPLTYLNACRTAVSGQTLSSIASAFLNRSLATIATHADIAGGAAAQFAGRFYELLAEGLSIDVALSTARGFFTANNTDAFLPALTVRTDPDAVLLVRPATSGGHSAAPFVDRSPHRLKILHRFFAQDPKERRHVLRLSGPARLGKTSLSWWCVGALKTQDLIAIREDVCDYKNWFELLSAVARRPELSGAPMEPFLKLARDAGGFEGLKNVESFFSSFLEGLGAVAGDRQVILCFDEWKRSERGDPLTYLPILVQYLLNPIADGDGKIRALVPAEWAALPQIEAICSESWDQTVLDEFRAFDLPDLALEWFGSMFPDKGYPQKLIELIDVAYKDPAKTLPPHLAIHLFQALALA